MPKRTRDYRSWQLEKLADPDVAAAYLNAALADSPKMFIKAVRNVAQARQNVAQVAKEAGVTREALYREGNPTLDTLTSVLDVLGIDLIFQARSTVANQATPPSRLVSSQGIKVPQVNAQNTFFYRKVTLTKHTVAPQPVERQAPWVPPRPLTQDNRENHVN